MQARLEKRYLNCCDTEDSIIDGGYETDILGDQYSCFQVQR